MIRVSKPARLLRPPLGLFFPSSLIQETSVSNSIFLFFWWGHSSTHHSQFCLSPLSQLLTSWEKPQCWALTGDITYCIRKQLWSHIMGPERAGPPWRPDNAPAMLSPVNSASETQPGWKACFVRTGVIAKDVPTPRVSLTSATHVQTRDTSGKFISNVYVEFSPCGPFWLQLCSHHVC